MTAGEDMMADGLRITDEGIANLCAAIDKASPERINQHAEPSVEDIGGKDVFAALGPVAFLTRAVVEGRQAAVDDLIKRLQDGNKMICLTDQALGPANLPAEPIF